MTLFDKKLSKSLPEGTTWHEAIVAGVDLLEKGGYATKDLASAIFEATKKFGAYYVLVRGIALAHAPSGPYCIKPATSLVWLPSEIRFNEEDKWAKIIVVLSAPDEKSHMDLMREFGDLFGDDEAQRKLLGAKSLDDFFALYSAISSAKK